MGILLSFMILAVPMLAVAIRYAYGPRMQSFLLRFAGREKRVCISGYGLAIGILVAGVVLGLLVPSVSTNCNLRRDTAIVETRSP